MKKPLKALFAAVLPAALVFTSFAAACASPHEHELEATAAQAATCTEEGNTAYWYCDGCDTYFSDAEATTEITLADTVVAALGHDFATTWESDSTNHWHKCTRCDETSGSAAHADTNSDGKCDTCGYEMQTEPEVVEVTGVELDKDSISLEVGGTQALVATVSPENATDKSVTWSSDDEKIATVATDGTVTAVAAGTATITVTTTDGKLTDTCTVTVTAPADPDPTPGELEETTVYLVGDSTVCSFTDAYYIPRYGYGTQLGEFLDDKATIENLAMSGRSSYSFLSEPNYQTLVNSIGEGDYLIIGFGHNDEKAETARYTNPNLPYTDSTTLINGRPASFAYTLYHYYIQVAEEAGATPILCTPIVRASTSNDYTGERGHITTTEDPAYPGGDYPQAIRDLGEATDTTVIDLTAITMADYMAIGYDEASNYHAWSGTDDGVRTGVDNTHTNYFGAKMNAYYIATELAKSDNSLGDYVLADIVKPSYEVDYPASINNSYVEPDYAPFNPETDKSTIWNVTQPGWYGTAMGKLGGNVQESNYGIIDNGNGSFTLQDKGAKAKIENSGDSFVAVFMQLNKNQNFTISATVTLDTYTGANQTGFGIMLRDDILIDERTGSHYASNYVSAGVYTSNSGATVNALYSREDGDLDPSGNSLALAQGSSYTLTLTRENQTVTTTISDGTNTYTRTYTDFDFVAVDTEYMYLCLYTARINVTYTNVVYTDNGLGVEA